MLVCYCSAAAAAAGGCVSLRCEEAFKLLCVCVELYQQAVYQENDDGGFDVVTVDTSQLVTVSTYHSSQALH